MNKLGLILIPCMLAVAGCAVTVQPGGDFETQTVGVSQAPFVNNSLELRAYPGSRVIDQEQDSRASQTTFESSASVEAVYAHFHSQLASRGWQRDELETRPNRVEARYWRGDETVTFELNRQGESGRYRLEIERR